MIPPMAGETTLVTLGTSTRMRSASALHSFSVWPAYWNTFAFCKKTGDRRPEDKMKCPSSMAPQSRNICSTSSLSIARTPIDTSIPFERRDHSRLAYAGPLYGGQARTTLERCQNIGELRKIAHFDFEDHLVEVG